jgi:hypothetical protein
LTEPEEDKNDNNNDTNDPYLTDEEIEQLEYEREELIAKNILPRTDIKAKAKAKRKTGVKPKEDEKQQKKKYSILKYSKKGLLAEAVIIGGKLRFAISRINGDNEPRITLENSAENENEIFSPLPAPMSRVFSFESEEKFDQYIEKAKGETLDSLYKRVKAIWQKYIDADDFHISLCAADTIFTYFQDRIGLTHYLFFVGDGDTGKSNNLTVIEYVGYRVFKSIGITSANIYTSLGNREEGQGTICEDEADNIDKDHEKMKIYKSGYQIGSGVARTDLPLGVRSQNKWNTFSFKGFAGERLPDVVKAKGLNQRIIPLYCSDGFPKHDLAEVVSAEGEEELQPLLDELNDIHNLLFAYRLLHFHDIIPNIKLNIRNREKQLFKPILRVFQNTVTFSELLDIVSHFVNRRRESNADSYHAYLYTTISELIKQQNSHELTISLIWKTIKDSLSGNDIPNKPLSYDTSEYGTISQKGTIETLKQVFGAKSPKHHGTGRKLIFYKDKLARLERKYNLSTDIRITDGTDGTHVGLDAHLPPDNHDKEITKNKAENIDILHNDEENDRENRSEDYKETPAYPIDPSHASQASHEGTDNNNPDREEERAVKVGKLMTIKEALDDMGWNDSSFDPSIPDLNLSDPNALAISDSIYRRLIEQQYLPNLDRWAYRCREHPETSYYKLEGIETSHFKPVHGNGS